MTERLHFHFSLSCMGEGNGNPLECSCLENPRDKGALWAAVCEVGESQTRLKQLSNSNSIYLYIFINVSCLGSQDDIALNSMGHDMRNYNFWCNRQHLGL